MKFLSVKNEDYEPHGHPDFYKHLEEMAELHDAKNKDYTAGTGDPLGNFHRVSAILKIWGFDIPPSLVAVIYSLKQQDAHMWMKSQQYEGETEGSHERLRDEAIYKPIVDILEEEEKRPIPPELKGLLDAGWKQV